MEEDNYCKIAIQLIPMGYSSECERLCLLSFNRRIQLGGRGEEEGVFNKVLYRRDPPRDGIKSDSFKFLLNCYLFHIPLYIHTVICWQKKEKMFIVYFADENLAWNMACYK